MTIAHYGFYWFLLWTHAQNRNYACQYPTALVLPPIWSLRACKLLLWFYELGDISASQLALQTHTVSTARKQFGLVTAIMLWLTGSPWVLVTPENTSFIPVCFICLILLLLILFSWFVPLHVPVLTGDVYEQLPTITVVELAPFAENVF